MKRGIKEIFDAPAQYQLAYQENDMKIINPKGIAISPRPTNFGPIMYAGRLFEGLEALKANGFDCVELSIRSIEDISVLDFNKRIADLDLKVSGIATGQACLFDQLCLSGFQPAQRQKTIEHLQRITDFALEIGARTIIIGGIRGQLTGVNKEFENSYQLGVEAIRKCAEYTHDNHVQLVLEAINRYETNWIHTAAEGLRVLELVGISSVKMLLDTFHMNIEEASIVDALKTTGEKLGYMHFADNTRHTPGQGQTNFPNILKTLAQINYTGPIITEALPLPDDKTAVEKTAAFWKNMESEGV